MIQVPTDKMTLAFSEKLATEENALLFQAATNAPLHGPQCTCVGFGLMRRGNAELERDIVEFLLAKFEETPRVSVVHLLQAWIAESETKPGPSGSAPRARYRREGLLQWIDRNAPRFALTEDDFLEVVVSIRTLLQSLATPAGAFVCE